MGLWFSWLRWDLKQVSGISGAGIKYGNVTVGGIHSHREDNSIPDSQWS